MSDERTITLDAISRAMQAVGRSRLFRDFTEAEAHRTLKALQSGNKRSQTRGALLSELSELLSAHHPLLKLFVHSAYVKSTRQDLGEDTDSEDTDSDCEGDTTGNTTTHGEGTAAGNTGGPPNPMAGMSSGRIADYLVTTLKEVPHTRQLFAKLADVLGPDGMWEVLKEVNEAIARDDPDTVVSSGERKRTAGGLFLRIGKAKTGSLKKAKEAAQVRPDFTLRPYQQQAVDSITRQGGNWVVAAPTNTGKTAIFIEVSKRLLASKPQGTVVVLVPTVSLTRQQCNAYESAGFRPAQGGGDQPANAPVVDWFCSDKPLPPTTWSREVQRLNVIVIEAQSFANLVESGAAALTDIDILVFDECHHTAKEHPYARVMNACMGTPPEKRPQVLGVSASPAESETKLHRLLTFMMARLIVISEDDDMVQQVAPAPDEECRTVPSRVLDGHMQEWLRHLMHLLAAKLHADLHKQLERPSVPAPTRESVTNKIGTLPTPLQVHVNANDAYNRLCSWMTQLTDMAKSWELTNLITCVQILEVLRRSEAVCLEIGYECALQYLAQHLIVLGVPIVVTTEKALSVPRKLKRKRMDGFEESYSTATTVSGLSALNSHLSSGPTASDIRTMMESRNPYQTMHPCPYTTITGHAMTQDVLRHLSLWPTGRSTLLEPALGGNGRGTLEQTVAILTKGVKANVGAWNGVLEADRRMGQGEGGMTRPAEGVQDMVTSAVLQLQPGGMPAPPMCHHKVWELVQYLQRYKEREDFHGIIFCRSRQTAHFLVELLRNLALPPASATPSVRPHKRSRTTPSPALLGFIDGVELFVGHGQGNRAKARSIASLLGGGHAPPGKGNASAPDRLAARGMDVQQQQNVLNEFKAPGRKLLIATNAAEEGLDLPCCEFVVRFSPPATGIQRVQGRGRARKLGSHYLSLIQDVSEGSLVHGGHDINLHIKSAREEEAMRDVLLSVAAR